MSNLTDQAVALAAMMQALGQVNELASEGSCDQQVFQHNMAPLFLAPSESAIKSFGELSALKNGLEMMLDINSPGDSNKTRTALNYAISVLHLERQLRKNPEMLSVISNRLQHASYNTQHFETDPHAIAASIAAIYQDTLSTLSFRIQVQGNPLHLSDKYTADRIRALLLAAVRASRLWRQHGGSRLGLIFGRRRIQQRVQQLLSSIN